MQDNTQPTPDRTAVRVALWRALHLELDPPPHVFEDRLGLELAVPDEGWRERPDMRPRATARARASIVARARFIEDLLAEEVRAGIGQYVLLGAGLDSFAQRRAGLASSLRVFEIDAPGPQAWKRRRLAELGHAIPEWLRFVPVDFERDGNWSARLREAGFDAGRPAMVSSTGVAMYLTREAVTAMLREVAALPAGSTLALSFMQPLDNIEPEERPGREATETFARMAGTPFLSLFAPEEIRSLARDCGFRAVRHVSSTELAERYFAGRSDGLRPSSSEELLIATT